MQTFHPHQILNSEELALRVLEGSAVLFPTDTLPAVGALPDHTSQLWEIKKRPFSKPLILMGANAEELFDFVSPCALEDAWPVAKSHWPGALTLVLPSSSKIVENLNRESKSIGIRVPASEEARAFLKKSGPLATTSANPSGEKPSFTADEASRYFPQLPLLGPLPWPICCGTASTVLAWEGLGTWRLLRSGALSPDLRIGSKLL